MRVEDAPRLEIAGRRRPAGGLEQRQQLGLGERLARHRARRPAVEKEGIDGMVRVADVAALLHSVSIRQYPSLMMPFCLPSTVPFSSHSSEARKSDVCTLSHIALCEAHPRSTITFCDEP